MQNFFRKKRWRTLAVVLFTVAIFFSVVTEVAYKFAPAINYALKVDTSSTSGKSDDEKYNYFPSDYSTSEEIAAYGKAVSREVEAEGLVMLKNKDSALPLASGTNVSAILQMSVDFGYGASGSGKIDASKYADLKTALEGVGLNVNSTLWDFYKANPSTQGAVTNRQNITTYKDNTLAWSSYSDAAKSSISSTGGTAVVVLKRTGGEGEDISTTGSDGYDGSYLSLTENEIEILSELTTMKNNGQLDSIVVLLNMSYVFQTAFLQDNWEYNGKTVDVDACLWVGNVGIGGIYAVADALVGNVNPSGKLSDTYVKDNFSSPAMAYWMSQDNKGGTFATKYENASALSLTNDQTYYGVYVEGIYVGYRYYETRYEDVVCSAENVGSFDYSAMVSYPFGYGLSYTTFEYSNYDVKENEDGDFEISVNVKNTGNVAGKEVVQVYLQKPYTDYDKQNGVEKAAVELVGFSKTKELEPNDDETVTVTVERESFKTYDANGYKTYILEAGDYYLAIGTSSHDALNNILAQKGKTTADGMDEDGNAALAKKVGEDIVLDTTTYATSSTDEQITNRLDFCDINKYEGKGSNSVTYVSRNDWTGTYPNSKITLTATDDMKNDLANGKSIEEEEGATMPEYGVENGMSLISLRGKDYNDEDWDKILDQMTWTEQTDLVTKSMYGTLGADSINLPALKAQDGPTGAVDSKEDISFPSEGIWASTFNVELIRKVGDAFAEDVRDAGQAGMYVPGVNIHRAPFGGRTHEYFSEDPFLSAVSVESEIKGLQAKGVIPYVKHYVFNDQEDQRIGVGIWLNEQSARELYLKPFEYAVSPEHGNAHGVMSSFNRAGCVWTSASKELMTEILRDEFGFDGVVLTDMATGQESFMTYNAFAAGTDLWLASAATSTFDTYAKSATFRNYVREAVHRYLYVIANYSAGMNGFTPETGVSSSLSWWQAILIACVVLFFALAAAATVLTAIAYVKEKKSLKN